MAKAAIGFSAAYPLDTFLSGSQGKAKSPGVRIEDSRGRAIVQIFAVEGKIRAVERALKIAGTPGTATRRKRFSALPVCPGQWLLVSHAADKNFAVAVSKKLQGIGYVSEQSDSRIILAISGPKARQLMQKGCRLDLHPSVAKNGFCGQTRMAGVGVMIHQLDAAPTYELMVFSGFAQDFAEWLTHSAAEFGLSFTRKES